MKYNHIKEYLLKHKVLSIITFLILLTIPISVLTVLNYRTSFPQASRQFETNDKLCVGEIENITLGDQCINNSGYLGMTYTCNDNSTGTFFSNNCIDEQALRTTAEQICINLGLPICKQSFGEAIKLDGQTAYMLSSKNLPATDQMTVEAWVNPSSQQRSTFEECDLIVTKAHNPGFATWKFAMNPDNTLTFILETPEGGSLRFPSNQTLPIDQWSHIAYSLDKPNGTASLFINGVQTNTISIDPQFPFRENNEGIVIGAAANQDGTQPRCFYSGQIDEIRISNTNRYNGNFDVNHNPFTTDNYTQALWHFDHSGLDASGNSNHAYPYGNLNYVESTIPAYTPLPTGVEVREEVVTISARGFVKNTNQYPKLELYVNYSDGENNSPVAVWDTTAENQIYTYTSNEPVTSVALGFSNQQYNFFLNRTSFLVINSVNINTNELAVTKNESCQYDLGQGNRAFDNTTTQRCQPEMFWNGVLKFSNF